MSLSLEEVLSEHFESYARAHRSQLCAVHYRAVNRVLACRTIELGGRVFQCNDCSKKHFAYHSCNHRSCPTCGAHEQQLWTAKQEARLLPVPYFMVTFTLPAELRPLCKRHPKELYNLILKQSAAALKDIIATKNKPKKNTKSPENDERHAPSYSPSETGFTSVLHTWGRQLQHHPHVHTIVPALALRKPLNGSSDIQFVHPKKDKFLIHFYPLAARFRSLIHSTLKSDHPEIYRTLTPQQRHALSPQKQWNVNLQHIGKGATALRYLARYVCKSGYSDQRLIGYTADKKHLLLRYTPSGTRESKILKLTIDEFIRRWLTHVLPKRFARIRHYGFLSSAAKKTRQLIWDKLGLTEPEVTLPDLEPFACPHCDGILNYLRDIPRPSYIRGP